MRQPAIIVVLSVLVAIPGLPLRNLHADDGKTIEWITQYGPARRLGTSTARPVLLFLTTDGCSHCVRMKDTSFRDSTIVAALRESFVPAMVKVSGDSELAKQLRITIYPTTVIISPDGKILEYARGYLSPEQLRERMSLAMQTGPQVASKH